MVWAPKYVIWHLHVIYKKGFGKQYYVASAEELGKVLEEETRNREFVRVEIQDK